MKDINPIEKTFSRFKAGQLNEAEVRFFLEDLRRNKDQSALELSILKTLEEEVDEQLLTPELERLLDDSLSKIKIKMAVIRPMPVWRRIAAVAAVLFMLLSVGLLWVNRNSPDSNPAAKIVPGKETATLTLSNGTKIRLQESGTGELAKESGVRISKNEDGQLVYEIENQVAKNSGLNTLSTARGESYKVRLPDGSQVWLNAASSISYPANFLMHESRNITLKGEAYFEVAKDAKRPFIVNTDRQKVEVLGTRFNINSYVDEPAVRTTLLEGKVKINSADKSIALHPGQEARLLSTGNIQLADVDPDKAVAWTKNEFVFDSENIESVMRKISRWYNVEVIYEGEKTNEQFNGGLSRFDQVADVLSMLEKTKAVQFNVSGRKIYVINKNN